MKCYIKASTKYKENDKRIPLIRAIQEVLGVDFTGNKSVYQYSTKYDCYLRYVIMSGKSIGRNRYKMSIYQNNDEPEEKLDFRPNGYRTVTADVDIMKDICRFLESNYSEFFVRCNEVYGFVICDAYFESDSITTDAESLYNDVYSLLDSKGYEVENFTTYQDYITVQVVVSLMEKNPELQVSNIRSILESNGYHVKSISLTRGSKSYPAYWMDHRIKINIYYN